MKVFLIGIGMGNPDTATVAAHKAIDSSDLIIGGERMLESFAASKATKLALTRAGDIVGALEQAREKAQKDGAEAHFSAAVLLSGDVGFYSGATSLYKRLDSFQVEVIPGISSLNYLCAKARTPWQDAHLVSAHGRIHNVVGAVQAHEKTFAITGGATKVQDICAQLVERGLGHVRVVAGENLSYAHERIVEGSAADLACMTFADLSVMLVFNDNPVKRPYAAPSLSDDEFERTTVPMTKEEVRCVVVAKMRVSHDAVVWDVGAGTGSVSVELALACPSGRVIAIEKNHDACELIKRNRDTFGAINLDVVEGSAPEALAGLPAPDCVFIGGSSGALEDILRAALSANPSVRIVVSAIALETVSDALRAFSACGLATDDIVQLNVSRARKAGSHHLMMANNPVYVISGEASSCA